MAFEKAHMHRCAPFALLRPTKKVGLTPRYSRALPLKLFETPYCKYVVAAYNLKVTREKIRLTPNALRAAHLSSFERQAIIYMLF
jgi:hypothetical protein